MHFYVLRNIEELSDIHLLFLVIYLLISFYTKFADISAEPLIKPLTRFRQLGSERIKMEIQVYEP